MKIGFVVWNPFMVYHMADIAAHVEQPVFLILDHQPQIDVVALFGDDPDEFIGFDHKVVTPRQLATLDGSMAAMVCPNPFVGMEHIRKTKCIGMQYSMAKDRYVNGPWRAMFDMTMTYGRYSAERISHFCQTAMVGNPRFHRWFAGDRPGLSGELGVTLDRSRPTLLYLPTWGEFSSVDVFMQSVIELSADYNVLIKVHHKTESHEADRKDAVASQRTVHYFGAMDDLLPLLDASDVVMSDYSGAIFDAIYVRKPVILLQSDPAAVIGKKFGFESIEYARRDEIGPTVASPDELQGTVASVVSGNVDFRQVNERLRSEIFEHDRDSGAIAAKSIEDYLAESPDRPMHQIYLRDDLKADRIRKQKMNIQKQKMKEDLEDWKAETKTLRSEINRAHTIDRSRAADTEATALSSIAERLFNEGVSLERNREWKAAAVRYRSALGCDDSRPEWHARLGFVLEQQSQWKDAAAAFEAALRYIDLTEQ